jgi:TonB family protein
MCSRHLSLNSAITDGDTDAVRALLAAGANVNEATSGGQTPLILAIVFRRIQIMRLLLDRGADPQLRDSVGLNAIDWATRRGFPDGETLLAQFQEPPVEAPKVQPNPPRRSSSHSSEMESADKVPEQLSPADEKTRRWLAGLKRRFDEENRRKDKQAHSAPTPPTAGMATAAKREEPRIPIGDSGRPATTAPEPLTKTEPPRAPVNDGSLPASTTAPEPQVEDPRVSFVAPEPVQLKDKHSSAEAVSSQHSTTGPQRPKSIIERSDMPSNPKRCPKCNTVYDGQLLAYCAIDMTPLVDANEPVQPAPPRPTRTPLLWLLVVFMLVVSIGLTYFMTRKLTTEQDSPPKAPPVEEVNIKVLPLVGGELKGKEIDVPEPEYPAKRVAGSVTVRVTVDRNGRVIAARVSDGDPRLRDAALAAAQKARFSPEKLTRRGAMGTIMYTFRENH